MRLAIATRTGPEVWGLAVDEDTIVTFELELEQLAASGPRRAQVARGR